MKLTTSVILAIIVASSGAAFGADGAALWAQNCASCHGKDGSGNTTMGKKLGLKDYTKTRASVTPRRRTSLRMARAR